MKTATNNYAATLKEGQSSCEILVLPDGRILAHNVSPEMAEILSKIDPANTAMQSRAKLLTKRTT